MEKYTKFKKKIIYISFQKHLQNIQRNWSF